MSETISFEEFKKLDIRIGKVLSVEAVVGSEKLIKMEVDLGTEKRQILAGILQYYKPEDLVGKSFVFLTNLEPKKMMGLESQGMILCADKEDEPICLSPLKDAPPGTIVR
jgi:methionine--tRNA ligase beta chain